ncbi:MAG: hypothetical protein HQ567_30325 [Candidatus Nealsonbacteria bacterium]|nr:hypothetical protein [Candidatus Nealsonbacteria bacterium]
MVGAMFGFGALFLVGAILQGNILGIVFCGIWSLVIGACFFAGSFGLVYPMARELVLDGQDLRWGNVRKRAKQRCVKVSEIDAVLIVRDFESPRRHVVLRDGAKIRIPVDFLERGTRERDFLDVLRNEYPEITVWEGKPG